MHTTETSQPETVVAEFAKNGHETVRVALTEYRGHRLLQIRTWYADRETGALKPGKQGLSLRVEKVPELADAIRAAQRQLTDGGRA